MRHATHCNDKGKDLLQDLPFVQRERSPAGDAGGAKPSVLTRQQDGVVGEPEGDALGREVGVFDLLRVDDVVVAVVASQRAGSSLTTPGSTRPY
jgi:hypothetical protein